MTRSRSSRRVAESSRTPRGSSQTPRGTAVSPPLVGRRKRTNGDEKTNRGLPESRPPRPRPSPFLRGSSTGIFGEWRFPQGVRPKVWERRGGGAWSVRRSPPGRWGRSLGRGRRGGRSVRRRLIARAGPWRPGRRWPCRAADPHRLPRSPQLDDEGEAEQGRVVVRQAHRLGGNRLDLFAGGEPFLDQFRGEFQEGQPDQSLALAPQGEGEVRAHLRRGEADLPEQAVQGSAEAEVPAVPLAEGHIQLEQAVHQG